VLGFGENKSLKARSPLERDHLRTDASDILDMDDIESLGRCAARSLTGILHVFHQNPIDIFSRKQNTVETVTYAFVFSAACIEVDPIVGL